MDEVVAALATSIGERVRRERQSRRWTLDQLASVAGVSRRVVVNVEQGTTNPSVGTLLRLSDALGVGLPALVESKSPRTVRVTRAGEGAALWTSGAGGRGLLVAGTTAPDVIELWDWMLTPGDCHSSEAHISGTQELLQVREGRVRLTVDGHEVDLHPGDAATFSGAVPHAYANPGTEPARFTLAVSEPGVGTTTHAAAVADV